MLVPSIITGIYDSLLTVVYPMNCKVCGESVERVADGAACRPCWRKTRIFTGAETLCSKCGAYLSEHPGGSANCGKCTEHFYDGALAAGIYEFALAASVVDLKSSPRLGRYVRRCFLDALRRAQFSDIDIVVPVPLSKKRYVERGFNQADVLGNAAGKMLEIKPTADVLVRKLHTPMHRAAMDKKAREMTVMNAFEVADADAIRGKSVLLIDDVLTSGSTASQCAKILKKNGAACVKVFTLARAV